MADLSLIPEADPLSRELPVLLDTGWRVDPEYDPADRSFIILLRVLSFLSGFVLA